jgi:flavorubredoxin
MICPSHGIIWRQGVGEIIELYQAWAANYKEGQVSVIYDTMWSATKEMAEAIAEGLRESRPDLEVKLFNTSLYDKNDVIAEIFKSSAVLAGSPTFNRGILSSMAGILEMIKGLGFKEKQAAAFGSFGWTGESADIIEKSLAASGFEILSPSLRVMWQPDQAQREACVRYGREFGQKMPKRS